MPLGLKAIRTAHIAVQGGTDGQGKGFPAIPGHILPQSQPLAFIDLLVHKEAHRGELLDAFPVRIIQVPGIILRFFEQALLFDVEKTQCRGKGIEQQHCAVRLCVNDQIIFGWFYFQHKSYLLSFYCANTHSRTLSFPWRMSSISWWTYTSGRTPYSHS